MTDKGDCAGKINKEDMLYVIYNQVSKKWKKNILLNKTTVVLKNSFVWKKTENAQTGKKDLIYRYAKIGWNTFLNAITKNVTMYKCIVKSNMKNQYRIYQGFLDFCYTR